jgi:hypothetical protein
MAEDKNVLQFLSQYDKNVFETAIALRKILFANLPNIIEQLDTPAKMVGYCYGQKYIEMICAIIPSKKGVKVSFYKGIDLPDPEHLLAGAGKITRYVEITPDTLNSSALELLIKNAFAAYKQRISIKK